MTHRAALSVITAAWASASCGVEATPSPMDLGRYEAALVRQMNGTYTGTASAIEGGGICEHAGATYSLGLVSRSPVRCVYEDVDAACDYAQQAAIDVVEGHLAVGDAPAIDARGSLHVHVGVGDDGRDVAVATVNLRVNVVHEISSSPDGGFRPDDGLDGFEVHAGWACVLGITEFTANQ